jgi:hypothetical protein
MYFIYLYNHVNFEHGDGVIEPLVICSDQTSLPKDRKINGHPIYLMLVKVDTYRKVINRHLTNNGQKV